MHDTLISYIREHPEGVDSRTLAERILKFKSPERQIAHSMVVGILGRDSRCRLDADGLWRPEVQERTTDVEALPDVPWAAVHALADQNMGGKEIVHVSVWTLFDTPAPLASEWLVDPQRLGTEERETLCSPSDASYDGPGVAVERLASALDNRAVIFMSGWHQSMLTRELLRFGESTADDAMLIGQVLKVGGLSVPRPLTLASCYRTVFEHEPVLGSAHSRGGCFADCAWEALRRLIDQGIVDRAGLDRLETKHALLQEWPGKAFSLADVVNQPTTPGVYGFKDRAGKYVYVGKAKNLRRRLRSYFRSTEEPEPKAARLQLQAHDLTVHRCGSELESLILEHRLIRKHSPALNTQVSIGERRGEFRPVPDCIILLPHAEPDKGMSVWLRRDQRAQLKPFGSAFRESVDLRDELSSFFYSRRLVPNRTDFAELEIVHRWVRRHEEGLTLVPVSRLSSVDEILEWMKSSWGEMTAPSLGSDE